MAFTLKKKQKTFMYSSGDKWLKIYFLFFWHRRPGRTVRADIRADIRTDIREITDVLVELSVLPRISLINFEDGYP